MLWPKVSTRLDTFLQHPGKRSKSACPNLGLLMPLLSCSPVKHSWSKMSAALLEEALDRKVLWMCKKDPSLVKSFQEPLGSPPHMDLLRGSWAGAMVSCRLTAFHLAFLQLVAAPKGSTLEAVMDSMDAMYGWPAAALGSRFVNVVKRFQQVRLRECCSLSYSAMYLMLTDRNSLPPIVTYQACHAVQQQAVAQWALHGDCWQRLIS